MGTDIAMILSAVRVSPSLETLDIIRLGGNSWDDVSAFENLAGLINESYSLRECSFGNQKQKKKFKCELTLANPTNSVNGHILFKKDGVVEKSKKQVRNLLRLKENSDILYETEM